MKRHGRRPEKGQQGFEDWFEERKVLEYLGNMIGSEFLEVNPSKLFWFVVDILGDSALKEFFFMGAEAERTTDSGNITHIGPSENITEERMKEFLRSAATDRISERLMKLERMPESALENQIKRFSMNYALSHAETEILVLLYLTERLPLLKSFFDVKIAGFSSLFVINYFPMILGLEKDDVVKAITTGSLVQKGMIRVSPFVSLTREAKEEIEQLGENSIEVATLEEDRTELTLSDFGISDEELMVLERLIKGKGGFNLLLTGRESIGMDHFAMALAQEYDLKLQRIDLSEEEDLHEALRTIQRSMARTSQESNIVMVSGAEELFDRRSFFYKRPLLSLKEILRHPGGRFFWVLKGMEGLSRELVTKMTFVLELKPLGPDQRQRIVRHELKRHGLEGLLEDDGIRALCNDTEVDIDDLVEAIRTASLSEVNDESGYRFIGTVLRKRQMFKPERIKNIRQRDFRCYDLECLNCSEQPERIISALRRYEQLRQNRVSYGTGGFTMLLYGPPGTGKTEFVFYLGSVLGREVVLRRASDIFNCYVGNTEKLIMKAFVEAKEKDAILFFDEADTFLFPRKNALRSWEVSFTNEFLTQIENFQGIVVFSTNHIEGLDTAALRRFRFKVEFRPLKPEGVVRLYEKLLMPLIPEANALTEEILERLRDIKGLTPGDFATVREKFLFLEPSDITHERLLEALKEEVAYREGEKRISGFMCS